MDLNDKGNSRWGASFDQDDAFSFVSNLINKLAGQRQVAAGSNLDCVRALIAIAVRDRKRHIGLVEVGQAVGWRQGGIVVRSRINVVERAVFVLEPYCHGFG